MSFKRTFGVASSIAIAAALAAPAYAQDESGQEADSSNRNTEIIVTAQFREQRLQDTLR
jgi:iron complex outermembrane receptor protein